MDPSEIREKARGLLATFTPYSPDLALCDVFSKLKKVFIWSVIHILGDKPLAQPLASASYVYSNEPTLTNTSQTEVTKENAGSLIYTVYCYMNGENPVY